MIEYEREPARSCWQRFGADVLRHLPIEGEL
jgi:hypothetical protein